MEHVEVIVPDQHRVLAELVQAEHVHAPGTEQIQRGPQAVALALHQLHDLRLVIAPRTRQGEHERSGRIRDVHVLGRRGAGADDATNRIGADRGLDRLRRGRRPRRRDHHADVRREPVLQVVDIVPLQHPGRAADLVRLDARAGANVAFDADGVLPKPDDEVRGLIGRGGGTGERQYGKRGDGEVGQLHSGAPRRNGQVAARTGTPGD